MRQDAVLDADDEHVAELQALGRVQAHQPHLVAGVALVGVRQQRERGGEFAGAGRARAVEPVGEFVEVAAPALEGRLVLALRAQHRQQAAARSLSWRTSSAGGSRSASLRRPRSDVGEATQRIRRARRQLLEQADGFGGARQRQVRVLRQFGELGQRRRADFALGRLHRAQERRVVVGIGDQPQPRHRILDLAAIQERRAAGQVVGHAQQLQRFFQRARLVVAAEQHAEIAPRRGMPLDVPNG